MQAVHAELSETHMGEIVTVRIDRAKPNSLSGVVVDAPVTRNVEMRREAVA